MAAPTPFSLATSGTDPKNATKEGLETAVNVSLDAVYDDLDAAKADASSLSNVNNTSDADKPVSAAQQAALDAKVNSVDLASVATSGAKADVGLGNADNTSDADKPVSVAQQAALDAKVNSADLAAVATSGGSDDLTEGATQLLMTPAERSKLAGVDAGADVAPVRTVAGRDGDITLAKADVGLDLVENLAPASLPVSDLQAEAIAQEAAQRVAVSESVYFAGVLEFSGALPATEIAPARVGADNRVLQSAQLLAEMQARYRDGLLDFSGVLPVGCAAPAYIGADNAVILAPGAEWTRLDQYFSDTFMFAGEAASTSIRPLVVGGDNSVIFAPGAADPADEIEAYIDAGTLRAVGAAGPDWSVNADDGRTWYAARAMGGWIRGVCDFGAERQLVSVCQTTGDIWPANVIDLHLGYGQSNAAGSQGGASEVLLSWSDQAFDDLLMLGPDVWMGADPGDDDEVLDASALEFQPLVGALSGVYGIGPLEVAALRRMQRADADLGGYLPTIAVINAANGGHSIDELEPVAPADQTAWANLDAGLRRAAVACPDGQRIALRWVHMGQGEANTTTADLGAQHDAVRAEIEALAQEVFGQTEPVRMVSSQQSSFFGASDGPRSILQEYLDHAAPWGDFFCLGPTYAFEFNDEYLHHTAAGHVRRGEYTEQVIRHIERFGDCAPLHMVSATITDTQTISVTLSESAQIVLDHPVVAVIDDAGISVPGYTVAGVEITGSVMTITTSEPVAGALSVEVALVGQNSPRTAARIPRSNIFSTASLGDYSDGAPMLKPAAHQSIEIT
ncbi:hypothetical protein [Shimia thalassica]|uniref:hypothetical protein n=1 Tax=Shimia thalassica TaxID=1715693 RepID=UPI0026E1D886|nr:hypothetical protein [Shimia thalassica]MDO6799354.1 hypothetical protein [Shimia thalassica]